MLGQRGALVSGEGGIGQAGALREVGHQARLAAGAADRDDGGAGQRPAVVQELQGFEQGGEGGDLGDAEAGEEGGSGRSAAGERGGVGEGGGAGGHGAAGLERDDRLRQGAGLGGHRLEGADVAEALDVEAEGGDAGVVEERRGDVGEAGLGLVAGGHDVGERQAAALHGQVDGDVGACATMATPESTGRPPCTSGQSVTLSR